MKNALALLALVPLLGACGDPEPTPVEDPNANANANGDPGASANANAETADPNEVGNAAAELDPEAAALAEAKRLGALIDPNHPHPEWLMIEPDPEAVVAAIEPEEYVAMVKEALKHYGTKEDPIPIDTDFLGAWEFDETLEDPFPPHVRAIDGCYIVTKGFMLPDVDFEGITNFHLVRSLWACCFGAPPRLNELIRVSTPDEEGLRYTYNTLEVIGRLEVVFETEDGLINDLYRMTAESIVEGEYDDPLAPEGADPEQYLPEVTEMEF